MVDVAQIKNFEHCTIHRDGTVYYKDVLVKPYIEKRNGLVCVSLPCEGKKKRRYIHRLLAEAFIDNPNKYKNVRRISSADNSVENLEWYSPLKKKNRIAFETKVDDVIEVYINSEKKYTGSGWLTIDFKC